MPFRMLIVRPIAITATLLALSACANLAREGEELWPYGYGSAEGPDDPPRLVTDSAPAG